jgi:hypothetical protein
MRARALAAAAVAAVAVVPFGAVAAQADTEPELFEVNVVHVVPLEVAAIVDVYAEVGGEFVEIVPDLAFESDEVVEVPAGTYPIEVRADDEDTVLISGDLVVEGDTSAVAQLDESGAPILAQYADDLSPTDEGNARVTVRHAAQAPPVDIAVNGDEVIADLPNGEQLGPVELPAGSYDVETSVDGTVIDDLSAAGLTIEAGVAYFVYAYSLPGEAEAELLTSEGTGPDEEDDEDEDYEEGGPLFALLVLAAEVGEEGATPTDDASTPTTPVIPTAVPAGDGTSGWTGPLALPALIALTLAGVLALAVGLAVRKSGSRA